MKGNTKDEIEAKVLQLSSREVYFSHGSVINYVEARAIGLEVEYLPPDSELWKKIWLLYCMYDHDCRRDKYLKIFEGPNVSTTIAASRASSPDTAS